MADLKTEYTDTKDIKHIVEHFVIPDEKSAGKEQIIEDLLHALAKPLQGH